MLIKPLGGLCAPAEPGRANTTAAIKVMQDRHGEVLGIMIVTFRVFRRTVPL
jgi:hypothetical protein